MAIQWAERYTGNQLFFPAEPQQSHVNTPSPLYVANQMNSVKTKKKKRDIDTDGNMARIYVGDKQQPSKK